MRLSIQFTSLTCVFLLFMACNRSAVSLSSTNAKGEVPLLGNLTFRFNQSMIADSLLNRWDSTEYIKFEPAIAGKFRWDGPDQLVFSPAGPLDPATTYKANITSAVLQYSSFDKVESADDISFHTPDLKLDNSQVIWIGESSTSAAPQIDLYFNYPVKPADVKDKLLIESDGKKMDYSLLTTAEDSKISIKLTGIRPEDRDIPLTVRLESGVTPAAGRNATRDAIEAGLTIPSPFVVQILETESLHDGEEGVVRVMTSQQLTSDNLKSFISIDPSINFTAEVSESGLTLRSTQFSMDKGYAITLKKGLRGKLGGTLKEDYQHSITFGELEADIRFTNSKGVYLSKLGGQQVEVRITSVAKVKLIISKIYESNLLAAQRYGYYARETSANENYYDEGYYDYGGDYVLGDVIYEKEIDTRSLPKSAGGRLLDLSQFEDRLPDFKGIYHVSVRSVDDYWVRDSRFIAISDLGLIAREGKDKMLVFVNSLKTSKGISGVNILVYGTNNQLLGTAATNGDGAAEISFDQKDYAGFRPAMVIARTADDFNYLPFTETRINTSRFDVGGKRDNSTGLDAYIYPERDIYRPGEKINFAVILRDRNWQSPGALPVKMKMLLPNGKELTTMRTTLNEEGAAEGSISLSGAAITGSYTLELYSANEVLLGSQVFAVEEFVPDRIRVQAQLNQESYRPGQTAVLKVNAANFFGPPAANRNVETEIQIRQRNFQPEKFADFNFALANQYSMADKEVKEGETDSQGNLEVSYTVPAIYADMGRLQATFYTTVFDETGRPVSRASSADIFTQDVFYGIQQDWSYYFPLNRQVKFGLVAVNKQGDAISAPATVKVIKHEYRTVLAKSGSYFRYESQKEEKLVQESQLNLGTGSSMSFIPRSPGEYEVRVYKPGASTYVMRRFYSYGSWGGDNNSFEVNTEGQVDIKLDKESYLAGETVKALFNTPFNGRLLVTMETDKVLSYSYVDVNNRSATLDLPLSGQHVPNVYITATLIKPHEMSDIPLTVAHGYRNIKVEEKSRRINMEISAAKTARSRTKQKITVDAAPGSMVTLAAVDNGILQVSGFESPDPYKYFYQKKALQVLGYDLYPLLFAEVKAKLSSTGGDGEMDMTKRVNPMPAKRVQLVSFWSGIKKANGSGKAEFEVEVPSFSGELRLMAVAFKGNSFGAVQNTMTIADPVVISTALPRFLSPGDTVSVPVTISNTTDKNANLQASLAVTGPVKVVGNSNSQLSINAKAEGRPVFKLVASPDLGVAKVKVSVKGMGETFEESIDISVRPASTLQKRSGSGVVAGGQTGRANIDLNEFLPASASYKLVVSRSPALELGEQLRYLVQYPYGCTEQTISSVFPQLYFGDLADLVKSGQNAKQHANANILEAIRKIKMRQLYTGALTLWDGSGTEDWWTSIYGAHFLLEARKAGFDVDNSLLETLLAYLNGRLKNRSLINYYYNRDQNRKIAPKEVAYSLYVLALAGRSNVSSMNYYKANPAILALDSRYLLSAAYAVAGDKRSFAEMLPGAFQGEESVPQTGGSFYSDIRDEAIALNALLEVDPGNKQVPTMVKHVSQKLKSRTWLSTQERAFAFLAIGKHARMVNKSTATAEIRVNGKVVGKAGDGSWTGTEAVLQGTQVEIAARGEGSIYYFWQAEGISKTGSYNEEDSYLKVRRRFYDRYGKAIDGNRFSQNDLVIVGITLERSFNTPVENVVITDLLPAGFEIENPRTKEIPGMDWIKDASTPTALDVRDDRIHFFLDLNSNKQTYYYAVRAVSPGQFRMGPVSADAMYNGEYHSYHGAGLIIVE
jgi:uncharacterized protein YfaS (alpha-2-macroglobulin family)